MANTIHGPYAPTSWADGVTPASQAHMNNLETEASVALHSLNPDLVAAGFVLSGVACTKDGSIASQLDVTSGAAYLIATDGTLARCDVASTNFSTTGHPSTTMYLDLNPTGTWSWGTSHSAVANHLTICSVTTNSSAQILVVNDARNMNATLLGALAGVLTLPGTIYAPTQVNWGAGLGGQYSSLQFSVSAHENEYWPPTAGATAIGHLFIGWTGSGLAFPLSIGASGIVGSTAVDENGVITSLAGQASAGSFGVPVIVAQALNVNVTSTALQTLATFTPPANGLYCVYGALVFTNGSNSNVSIGAFYTDPTTGGTPFAALNCENGWLASLAFLATAGTSIQCSPTTFYAKGGSPISLQFHDASGTPNDQVTMMLMRLS